MSKSNIIIIVCLLFSSISLSQPSNDVINSMIEVVNPEPLGPDQLDITLGEMLESLVKAKNTIQWEAGDESSEWILRISRKDKMTKTVSHVAWAFRVLSDSQTGISTVLLYRILIDGKELKKYEVSALATRIAPEARAKRQKERDTAAEKKKTIEK